MRVDTRMSFLISMAPATWQTLYFILDDGECVSVTLEVNDAFLAVLHEALSYLHLEVNEGEVRAEGLPITDSDANPQTV